MSTTPEPAQGTEKPPCRSVGPDGQPCAKKRGHLPMWHSHGEAKWTDGVNVPAKVYVKRTYTKPRKSEGRQQPESEADFLSWGNRRNGW